MRKLPWHSLPTVASRGVFSAVEGTGEFATCPSLRTVVRMGGK